MKSLFYLSLKTIIDYKIDYHFLLEYEIRNLKENLYEIYKKKYEKEKEDFTNKIVNCKFTDCFNNSVLLYKIIPYIFDFKFVLILQKNFIITNNIVFMECHIILYNLAKILYEHYKYQKPGRLKSKSKLYYILKYLNSLLNYYFNLEIENQKYNINIEIEKNEDNFEIEIEKLNKYFNIYIESKKMDYDIAIDELELNKLEQEYNIIYKKKLQIYIFNKIYVKFYKNTLCTIIFSNIKQFLINCFFYCCL